MSHRRQFAPVAVASSVVGVSTGAMVLALEHLIDDVLEAIFEAPVWVPAVTVVLGAIATALLVRFFGGRSSSTTETYIQEFHKDEPTIDPAHAPGRLGGAFTTLSSGAPMGLEGPAVYTGSVVATVLRRRFEVLRDEKHNVVLVAAAAAGIAAAFKAPAAGAIFALEVPYRGRLAGERLLPAIFGSATGFMTMAWFDGIEEKRSFDTVELTFNRAAGALVLGAVVGVVAIGVIWLIRQAEQLSTRGSPWVRAALAGATLAGLYVIGRAIAGESLALTSGNNAIEWAVEGDHAVWLLIAVFLLRVVGPAVSIAGGGVGGLFIPLMAAGAVVGRLFAEAGLTDDLTVYVLVGAAAMLGAGYAVPFTAVIFVAEYTGQAAVIVPGLLAVTAAMLAVGPRSVSEGQVP